MRPYAQMIAKAIPGIDVLISDKDADPYHFE